LCGDCGVEHTDEKVDVATDNDKEQTCKECLEDG
jgi:hypothetical protein